MDPGAHVVIDFRVVAKSGHARRGLLSTPHGDVETPAFMPVATQAAVKAVSSDDVVQTGLRMLIMNTYHLWLRPGPEVIASQGGLHEFSRFPHAIVTDSGGFQAYSLADRVRLSEEGFEFSSHLDGSRHMLSPEESMRVQGLLGSDIAMQLDVCLPGGATRDDLLAAVERTTRWAVRCVAARRPGQAVFGIVQGGTDVDLRLAHARELARLDVNGLALGGFSVGEDNAEMHRTLERVAPELDPSRPRYVMGVGTRADLVRAIGCGVDMFDCVLPTRNARNGQAFVNSGKLTIKNARYRDDPRPLEADCTCATCRTGYSRAFLRHAYIAGEIIALSALTLHNLHAYARLLDAARDAIDNNRYSEWAAERLDELSSAAELDSNA